MPIKPLSACAPQDYYFEMFYDDIPVQGFIGDKTTEVVHMCVRGVEVGDVCHIQRPRPNKKYKNSGAGGLRADVCNMLGLW